MLFDISLQQSLSHYLGEVDITSSAPWLQCVPSTKGTMVTYLGFMDGYSNSNPLMTVSLEGSGRYRRVR